MAGRFALAVVVLGLSAARPCVEALHSRGGSVLQGRQALAARAAVRHRLAAALRRAVGTSQSLPAPPQLQEAPRPLFPETSKVLSEQDKLYLSTYEDAVSKGLLPSRDQLGDDKATEAHKQKPHSPAAESPHVTLREILESIIGPEPAPSFHYVKSHHHDAARQVHGAHAKRRHEATPKQIGDATPGFDRRRSKLGPDGIRAVIQTAANGKDNDLYVKDSMQRRRSTHRHTSKSAWSRSAANTSNANVSAEDTSNATHSVMNQTLRAVWTNMTLPEWSLSAAGREAFSYKDPLRVMLLDFMKDVIEPEKIWAHITDIVPEPRHLYANAHCAGQPGWLNLATNLPDSFCVYDQAWGYDFAGRFDEFSTERFMLGRWMQSPHTCGNNEHMTSRLSICSGKRVDVIVAPSLHLHYMREQVDNHTYEWELMWSDNIAPHEKYWQTVRRVVTKHMVDSMAARPPFVVVHHAYTFDAPFSGNMLLALMKQPAWFVNKVVIATIESDLPSDRRVHLPKTWSPSAELLRTHREDGKLKPSEGVPTLVTVPYPVPVVTNTVNFSSVRPGYDHKKPRQIAVLLVAASKGDENSNNRIRYYVRHEMEKAGAICSRTTCLFCDGHSDGQPNCHPDFLDNESYAHQDSSLSYLWDFASSATFCLEPPGDTLTRSHFYVAALAGCIPVIFDGGHLSFAKVGAQSNTSWPWRLSPGQSGSNGLDYDTFTVRYKAANLLNGNVDFVKELLEMPKKDPGRFHSLRKGLDAALPALHYSLDDCGTRDCDAFAYFRDYMYRMRTLHATHPTLG